MLLSKILILLRSLLLVWQKWVLFFYDIHLEVFRFSLVILSPFVPSLVFEKKKIFLNQKNEKEKIKKISFVSSNRTKFIQTCLNTFNSFNQSHVDENRDLVIFLVFTNLSSLTVGLRHNQTQREAGRVKI
jgi:hypothetical protein